MPLPSGVAFVAVADLVAFLVLLAGGAPSISATSSRLLLDPPLATLDLHGPPGCLFPVISLLNGIIWHLKSVAQPVWDALILVILFVQDAIHVCGHRPGLFIGIGVDPFEVW